MIRNGAHGNGGNGLMQAMDFQDLYFCCSTIEAQSVHAEGNRARPQCDPHAGAGLRAPVPRPARQRQYIILSCCCCPH